MTNTNPILFLLSFKSVFFFYLGCIHFLYIFHGSVSHTQINIQINLNKHLYHGVFIWFVFLLIGSNQVLPEVFCFWLRGWGSNFGTRCSSTVRDLMTRSWGFKCWVNLNYWLPLRQMESPLIKYLHSRQAFDSLPLLQSSLPAPRCFHLAVQNLNIKSK